MTPEGAPCWHPHQCAKGGKYIWSDIATSLECALHAAASSPLVHISARTMCNEQRKASTAPTASATQFCNAYSVYCAVRWVAWTLPQCWRIAQCGWVAASPLMDTRSLLHGVCMLLLLLLSLRVELDLTH